jgi:DNA-binding response OmpR family regulator
VKAHVLIVDDEATLREILRDNLEAEGYRVSEANDGPQGFELAVGERPDLILMDVMMPTQDGLETTRQLRARGLWMPVVFLSARGDEISRVLGLEIGGDDYITKPFSMRELLARVKVILRRARQGTPAVGLTVGDRRVDLETYTVTLPGGATHALSHLEAQVLEYLASRSKQPVSRTELLNEVWGLDAYPTNRTVDNVIVRLRKKLEPNPKRPQHLITVHGVGYKLLDG